MIFRSKRVHLGFVRDKVDPADVGLVRTEQPLDTAAHVMVYSFDTENACAQLYVDGRPVAETKDVPKLDATNAPRFIGSHYDRQGFGFTGDIAEVIVYDGALSPEECQSMSDWLCEKYGIAVAGAEPPDRVAERGK